MNYDFFNGYLFCILCLFVYKIAKNIYKRYEINKAQKNNGYYFRAEANGRVFKSFEEFSNFIDGEIKK